VGRKFLEDTILKTNLEACREVVRQLRVRDIGGIIIIDFIDMSRRENREAVLAALEAELATDRTKTYVVELSPLGLVEMTRQNITDGVRGILTEPCPACKGEGSVLSAESLAIEVERRLRRVALGHEAEALLVEVSPQVAGVLLADGGGRLQALRRDTGKYLTLEGVSGLEPGALVVGAEGSREVIERAGLPVSEGQELEVTISEEHAYSHRDGVARLDGGYVVSVSGAGSLVGRKVRVVVESATRSCAHARLS
jgi:ribonuclease G